MTTQEASPFLAKLESIKDLHLPLGEYAICGSGPMAIRGMREAQDIDIIVKKNLWISLTQKYTPYDKNHIRIGDIEIWKDFINLTDRMDEVIDSAEIIGRFPYVSLEDTLLWKKFLNREKDKKDIKILEEYLQLLPGVYTDKPNNFSPYFSSSACFLMNKEKFLLLQKAPWRWSAKRWGVPCGRIEENEDIFLAMQRELFEETNIFVEKQNFTYFDYLYVVSKERLQYIFHMFFYELKKELPIKISEEHMNYQWISINDMASLPLIPGQKEAFTYFLQRKKCKWNL